MIKKNIFIKTALAVILTVITLSIISCSNRGIITVEENEFEVRFSLTGANTDNFSAVTATSATYTYAPNDSFTLTATKTNLSSSTNTDNFFHYTVTSTNVLNITGTTTNSITFALTNMDPGSVRITAIATNNLGQTNGRFSYTINLRKASYLAPPVTTSPITYVTVSQVGITGAVLISGVQPRSTYNVAVSQAGIAGSVLTYAVRFDNRHIYQYATALIKISGSATAGISADGTVTATNGISGTSVFEVRLTSPNYVDYVVRIISEVDTTIRLKEIIAGGVIPADLGSDPLVKDILGHLGATAGASIKVLYVSESGSGDNSGTDWNNAINGNNLRNTIVNISDASATKPYLVLVGGGTYRSTTGTDRNLSFTMKNFTAIIGGFDARGNRDLVSTTAFSGDIGRLNDNTDNTYQVFYHYTIPLNNAVLYGVTVTGGNADGRDPVERGGGMYNVSSSPRLFNVVFSNNYANYGGGMLNIVRSSPVLTGVVFSGNSAAVNGGGIMNQESSSPVLTGVEFSGNSATRHGGGILNIGSSPVLTGVEFNGNSATQYGGGMYNQSSSPVLTGVVFNGNSVTAFGGGMYNQNSSPVLTGVEFNGNSAANGGGILNIGSSPVLTSVVFSSNSSGNAGGGMLNDSSSSVLVGVTFIGNSTVGVGGGMFINNSISGTSSSELIVNTIFVGNTAGVQSPDVGFNVANSNNVHIAGSVLGVGLADPTKGILGYLAAGATAIPVTFTYRNLVNGAVNFGPNATAGILSYPTIQSSSSAVDIGLYVRRDGTTYYFSEDGTTWYTAFTDTGELVAPAVDVPLSAVDLTATDIAGNPRMGRPDAGVYEYRP